MPPPPCARSLPEDELYADADSDLRRGLASTEAKGEQVNEDQRGSDEQHPSLEGLLFQPVAGSTETRNKRSADLAGPILRVVPVECRPRATLRE
jgi:hypothetical protein